MPQPEAPRSRRFYVYAAAIVAVGAPELRALFRWGGGTGLDKLSAPAALLGFYGIGLGFFCGSRELARSSRSSAPTRRRSGAT